MNERVKEKIIVKYGTLKRFSEEVGIPTHQFYNKLNGSKPLSKPERILIALMLEEEEEGLFDE